MFSTRRTTVGGFGMVLLALWGGARSEVIRGLAQLGVWMLSAAGTKGRLVLRVPGCARSPPL